MHPRELERLNALRALQILDSPEEKVFDGIVELASKACETPMALISLLDDRRQWFKAKKGLQVTETPREFALCAHTILKEDIFEVEDAKTDERFFDNPLVQGNPGIAFYAGIRVQDPKTSLPIGTLCVLGTKPQKLSPDQRLMLIHMAQMVSELILQRHEFNANRKILEQTLGLPWQSSTIQANTEVESTRKRVLQSSKLSSLGEMSAGIAHEINNPLSVIIGLLPLLKDSKSIDIKFRDRCQSLEKAAKRIQKIVSSLKKYSRASDNSDHQLSSLPQVLEEALAIVEHRLRPQGIELEIRDTSRGQISCDILEIEQVLVNLLNNAVDALSDSKEKKITVRCFNHSGEQVLQIEDSGPGIPPDLERQIFDPFFTTKPVGKGTGLGLSISKEILSRHKASIKLNRAGSNTCFEVRIPISQGQPSPQNILPRKA